MFLLSVPARGIVPIVMTPPQLTALAAAPDDSRTNASPLVTALKTIAQSFGVAMLATLVQTQTTVHTRELARPWLRSPRSCSSTLVSPTPQPPVPRSGQPAARRPSARSAGRGGLLA